MTVYTRGQMRTKLSAIVILVLSVSAFAQFGGRSRQVGGGQFGGNGQTGGQCLVPGYHGTGEDDLPTPRDIRRTGFVYARVRYHVQPWWRGEIPLPYGSPGGATMVSPFLER